MSTDRRDVMPGRMGGEEKVKARGEDGRANHETAPTTKQGGGEGGTRDRSHTQG